MLTVIGSYYGVVVIGCSALHHWYAIFRHWRFICRRSGSALVISALMGHKVLPASETSTGYTATDIVEYISSCL